MKKNSILVKVVLMNMLTAGSVFSFTSCADDIEIDKAPVAPETEMKGQTRAASSEFNINQHSVIYGSAQQTAQPFNTKEWQNEQAIFCYVGEGGDNNIYDATNKQQLHGFKLVNLPWSNTAAATNIPQKIWKEMMPKTKDGANPWKLVLMNCGKENVPNGNFLGFYNELTGVLRIFVYVPETVNAQGSTHMWGLLLNDKMASRSVFRYGVPNDRSITTDKAKSALMQTDEMAQVISPWKRGNFTGFNDTPLNPGWWAFDMDFSTYRDLNQESTFASLSDNDDVLSVKTLCKKDESLKLESKLLAKLDGKIQLDATQASTSSGIFAPIEDLLGKGNDIADLAGLAQDIVNPNPLKAIENGIKLAKGACNLAGIDYGAETTSHNGYDGTMNLNMDGTIDTKGIITNQANVSGMYPVSLKKGDFLTENCPTFGEGIWNLENVPMVYITNAYTYWSYVHIDWDDPLSSDDIVVDVLQANRMSPFGGHYNKQVNHHDKVISGKIGNLPYAGYVSFFDPSSIKLVLNKNVFSQYEIEHAKVYATCGLRKGMDFGSTEDYRLAQGLEESLFDFSKNYAYINRALDEAPFNGLSSSDNKMGMKTGAKFKYSSWKGANYGAFGCGDDDYIINAQSLKGESGKHMMPALEVSVTVVVTNEQGREIVFSRNYLPQYVKIDVNEIPVLDKNNIADNCHPNYDKALYIQQRGHIKDIRDWTRQTLHPMYGTAIGGHGKIGYNSDKISEAYPCLIDGDVNTKWCSTMAIMKDQCDTRSHEFYPYKSKVMSDGRDVWYIEFETHFPVSPKGYTLVTANDNSLFSYRRPRTWALLGKKNINDSWTKLTQVETAAAGGTPNSYALPHTNCTPKTFDFNIATPKDMKYFRLEIINTWSNDNDDSMQLAEFRFNFD